MAESKQTRARQTGRFARQGTNERAVQGTHERAAQGTSESASQEAFLPALFTGGLAESAGGEEAGLRRYLAEVRQMPYLEAEEEHLLAVRWRDHKDRTAAAKLVTSHLRLVARLALGYRGYGLALSDLVSEGSLGLLKAVERFDPERRVRLSTYATWWIRAAIQEYILRSWSLVKLGSGAEQKRLFFRLRQERNRLLQYEGEERRQKLAEVLDVEAEDIREMESRLDARDFSLDAPVRNASAGDGEEGSGTWLERVAAGGPSPEEQVIAEQERKQREALLHEALLALPERERTILLARRLGEHAKTLSEVAREQGVSGERVRQLEKRGYELLKKELFRLAAERKILPTATADTSTP